MAEQPIVMVEKVIDAPLGRVWQAWSEPEQMKNWWGPKDFTAPTMTMDFRVGGTYLFCMRGSVDEGAPAQDFWSTGEYKEIVQGERIVCTDSFADAEGNVVPARHYGMPGEFPLELTVVVDFETLPDSKTKLTIHHHGMPANTGAEEGWMQSLDKLAASLA